MADDGVTPAAAALVAVRAARAFDAALKKLDVAPRGTTKFSDAHVDVRAAKCCWRAAVASAEAVDDAAVARARDLGAAAAAVDVAARRVVADVEPDVKLAAHEDLKKAEDAFKTLYKPLERARRPRPTSRAARRRPTERRRRRRRTSARRSRRGSSRRSWLA